MNVDSVCQHRDLAKKYFNFWRNAVQPHLTHTWKCKNKKLSLLLQRGKMIDSVITFQSNKILLHIINCFAVFRCLMSLRTHGSVIQIGRPWAYFLVLLVPQATSPHQRSPLHSRHTKLCYSSKLILQKPFPFRKERWNSLFWQISWIRRPQIQTFLMNTGQHWSARARLVERICTLFVCSLRLWFVACCVQPAAWSFVSAAFWDSERASQFPEQAWTPN